MRKELEQAREEAIGILSQERDEIIQKFEKDKAHLNNEISNVASERDAILINSENEKQQVRECF